MSNIEASLIGNLLLEQTVRNDPDSVIRMTTLSCGRKFGHCTPPFQYLLKFSIGGAISTNSPFICQDLGEDQILCARTKLLLCVRS